MTDPGRVDYLYKEYVRTATAVDALVSSSFDDIRLLAAIGILLAWPPLATSHLFEGNSSDSVLLFGLLAILFIIGALVVRDLLKQSIIRFQIEQVARLEDEIRNELGAVQSSVFRQAESWVRWEEQWYAPVVGRFALLFVLILLAFPDFVLSLEGEPWQVAVYSGTFIVVAAIVASGAAKVRASVRATTRPR
jgi:hypothetical protein